MANSRISIVSQQTNLMVLKVANTLNIADIQTALNMRSDTMRFNVLRNGNLQIHHQGEDALIKRVLGL
jgi:succinylglutamate desuccinylase